MSNIDTSEDRDQLELSTIDDTTLTEDDWKDVCQAVSVLSADWPTLARHLGLSASLIDTIARENPLNVGDCLSQVLIHWLRRNYNLERNKLPSWRTLAEAVKYLNKRLFDEIKKAHLTTRKRVRSDDDGSSREVVYLRTSRAHLDRSSRARPDGSSRPREVGRRFSLTTIAVIIAIVAVIAFAVPFVSNYTTEPVIASDSTAKMTQRGGGDKTSFRNFPHMNEKPTMNQLTLLERRDGGNPVRIVERIGASNSDLGIYLLKDNYGTIISTIEENARGKTEAMNREIFRRWLAGSGAPVSWKVLVDALEKSQLKALANDIVDALST